MQGIGHAIRRSTVAQAIAGVAVLVWIFIAALTNGSGGVSERGAGYACAAGFILLGLALWAAGTPVAQGLRRGGSSTCRWSVSIMVALTTIFLYDIAAGWSVSFMLPGQRAATASPAHLALAAAALLCAVVAPSSAARLVRTTARWIIPCAVILLLLAVFAGVILRSYYSIEVVRLPWTVLLRVLEFGLLALVIGSGIRSSGFAFFSARQLAACCLAAGAAAAARTWT